jgi:hypothetical protein
MFAHLAKHSQTKLLTIQGTTVLYSKWEILYKLKYENNLCKDYIHITPTDEGMAL